MSELAASHRHDSAEANQARSDEAVEPSLFPLPLVPFEHYMLTDDRAGYPMTFPVRVELEGAVDHAAMDGAFLEALDRHPLLTCRAVRRRRKWCWSPCEKGPPSLVWDRPPIPPRAEIRRIDLSRQPPVEARACVQGNRLVLDLLFHHAACDGIGAMVLVGDILAAYARRVAGDHPPAKSLTIKPDLLRVRGQFELNPPRELTAWEFVKGSVYETWKVLTRWPRALASGGGRRHPADDTSPTMFVGKFDAELFTRFISRAQQLDVTANDLLLRDMFLTVSQWNKEHAGRGGGWLRVNVPTSLRSRRDLRMPAANVLGYALLTLHDRQCQDREALLRRIAADTKAVRDWSLGALFVSALEPASAIPGGMWLGTRLMRRSATVVFSNLGDATRRFRARFPHTDGCLLAGNLRLVCLAGTPPVRPGTRLAMAIMATDGAPQIGFRADPRYLSEDDVEQFFEQFARRVRQTADEWQDVSE